MKGKLIGVGLGPGDPELMTLKAHRLISGAAVIAYPTLAGGDSFARAIAAGFFREDVVEIAFDVPMQVSREPAQTAYDLGAARIRDALDLGQDVVLLCEGDPLFYGSFMYMQARLAGDYGVEVVPGVTSVSASSARLGLPLVARNEVLTVIPAPLDIDAIRVRILASDAVAIMKLGRHMPKIRALIDAMGLTPHAVYIERASLPAERSMPLCEAPENAPYFSMILLTKGADPWL